MLVHVYMCACGLYDRVCLLQEASVQLMYLIHGVHEDAIFYGVADGGTSGVYSGE